jgi:lipopolysaccharide export system permease protein
MRRLDKLILRSFFGPFLLTTLVATFILLIQYMLKYFDDFVGKNLGISVLAELMFYFALNMLQVALPLGVLVSSLMTFGNLGENFELTAIKSAGISLIRTMRPIFIFVVILSAGAFYFNDYVVPAANLKAYSLLYDIKHKKPALDIKAGVFYDGIPNYSIKAASKLPDNKTLLDVMIYDHTERDGNRRVILADSSLMYTMYNDKYLKLELFDGIYYDEVEKGGRKVSDLYRTRFDKLDIVFSLSSFDLKRTKEELFRNNRQMKNIAELSHDLDSLYKQQKQQIYRIAVSSSNYLDFHAKRFVDTEKYRVEGDTTNVDSLKTNGQKVRVNKASFFPLDLIIDQNRKKSQPVRVRASKANDTAQVENNKNQSVFNDTVRSSFGQRKLAQGSIEEDKKENNNASFYEWNLDDFNEHFSREYQKKTIAQNALNKSRNFKVNITGTRIKSFSIESRIDSYSVEKYKKYSQAFACIVMFLIGAPLGAIIKKGGLGVPVIVSIFFFIIYYVLTISSEKWAKANVVDGAYAVWTADVVLFPFGLFFLRQARIDARLFDTDFYLVVIERLKTWLSDKKLIKRSV